jgi:hypothetical protein
MANIQRGESEAVIDGEVYRFVIDHSALAHAEWAAGVKINELLPALADPSRPQTLAIGAIIYGALRKHHRDLSMDDALNLAERGGEAIGLALGEAMEGAFPAAKAGAENPPKPPRGAGTTSKRTGRQKG